MKKKAIAQTELLVRLMRSIRHLKFKGEAFSLFLLPRIDGFAVAVSTNIHSRVGEKSYFAFAFQQ